MFYSFRIIITLVFSFLSCKSPGPKPSADLVLYNGKILTLDEKRPEVSALAIRHETILAVESDEMIQQYIGPQTEAIDLKGMLAIPGLIEGHGHYLRLGETLTQLDLRHQSSWEEIVTSVENAVNEAKAGDWIVGWGWHQDKWDLIPDPSVEGLPVHTALSQISPDNPVLLNHTSGHGSFVNARAMREVGINDLTPDPPGGEIVRDQNGNAIGMLRESAADRVKDHYAQFLLQRNPEEIEADRRRHVLLAGQEAIENGITSFQDMGSDFVDIDLFVKMADENELPVRLYAAIQEESEVMEEKLAEYRMVGYGNQFLTVRCIGEKVLDGALGTHGGWLLEPYTDLPRSTGFNVTPVEEIEKSAELAIEHDFQMAIQGIGDKASRILFDIYEESFQRNPGRDDFRWRIEHAQVIHPDDLHRFSSSGIIAGIQGIFACSDGPWVVDRLGAERTATSGYVFRSMIESGAVVMNGTDPPVEDINPLASFHCSVTRRLSDGSVFGQNQTLTRDQALRSYTINNAFAAFEEDIKGSLEVGKLADITVLTRDIMTIAEDEILDTEVAYTIIGGVVKYAVE